VCGLNTLGFYWVTITYSSLEYSRIFWPSRSGDFHTYVIVLEILPLGSCLYCGRHVSHNALVFSRSIGNKRRRATSFSQRFLVKLHHYRATIRGSKLPLFQVYFAVSLLPFGTSRQPKYVSSYCCSYLLSRELLVFSLSRKGFI